MIVVEKGKVETTYMRGSLPDLSVTDGYNYLLGTTRLVDKR
jgi:hypothetical protein